MVPVDGGGDFSSTEFNRMSQRAENFLMKYHVEQYERNRIIPEALMPFTVESKRSVSAGTFSRPSNYMFDLTVEYDPISASGDCGGTVSGSLIPVKYLEKSEWLETKVSSVRAPQAKPGYMYYTWIANQGRILPLVNGDINLVYLQYPVYAVRGFTIDAATDNEDYDASSSTDYSWDQAERYNLIDLMLFDLGVILRDSAIVEWVSAKTNIKNAKIQP